MKLHYLPSDVKDSILVQLPARTAGNKPVNIKAQSLLVADAHGFTGLKESHTGSFLWLRWVHARGSVARMRRSG